MKRQRRSVFDIYKFYKLFLYNRYYCRPFCPTLPSEKFQTYIKFNIKCSICLICCVEKGKLNDVKLDPILQIREFRDFRWLAILQICFCCVCFLVLTSYFLFSLLEVRTRFVIIQNVHIRRERWRVIRKSNETFNAGGINMITKKDRSGSTRRVRNFFTIMNQYSTPDDFRHVRADEYAGKKDIRDFHPLKFPERARS